MKKQYLHIGFSFTKAPDSSELTKKLDTALDWIRYAPNCYLVFTSSDANRWHARLKPFRDNGHYLIVGVDIDDRQGWLPKSVWDWIKTHRDTE